MRISIFIDDWKLIIFDRRLKKSGFTYEKFPGVSPFTMNLTVTTDDMKGLQQVVIEANTEAARKNTPHE